MPVAPSTRKRQHRRSTVALPFPSETFDFAVCRAAFKNFSDPVGALAEMHRVLRPGGTALIIDLRNDASDEAIDTGGSFSRASSRATGSDCAPSSTL